MCGAANLLRLGTDLTAGKDEGVRRGHCILQLKGVIVRNVNLPENALADQVADFRRSFVEEVACF